jgi:uncharacterized membrane protein
VRAIFIKIYDTVTESVWFVPSLMALLAGLLAFASVALDRRLGDEWAMDIGWVWAGGADGARSVLSVVAGSVMTVVSIVFSLTITSLAQTSSHFGPRVLRNFTSDRGVQFTLGTFIATFVYCLLVLRTVRSVEELRFVPFLSVNVGVALALTSLAVLIYFIHHVSEMIQAENLIAGAGRAFQDALPRLFPARIGRSGLAVAPPPEEGWHAAHTIMSDDHGYLQRIDLQRLLQLAVEHDLCCRLDRRPGDFVLRGSPLMRAQPPSRLTREIEGDLRACFSLGAHRTPTQDALYSVQQLVEIAAHALSPGINEPFTALTCIDWLGAALGGVASGDMPSALRNDDQGRLRVIARVWSFAELVHASFDQIRFYGASNPDVMVHLLATVVAITPQLHRKEDRQILTGYVLLIGEDAAQIVNASDRDRMYQHQRAALQSLSIQDDRMATGGDEARPQAGGGTR